MKLARLTLALLMVLAPAQAQQTRGNPPLQSSTVTGALGYTPLNKAGDSVTGGLVSSRVSGNLPDITAHAPTLANDVNADYPSAFIATTTTAAAASGTVISLASTTGIRAGMSITNSTTTGSIPANTTVTNIVSLNIIVSNAVTGVLSGDVVNIGNDGGGSNWRQGPVVFQQINATAGQAEWLPQNILGSPLMADAASSTAYGAWGVCRLTNAYTGRLLTVTRVSDSTTRDIYPDAKGCADWDTYASFVSGTSAGVSALYDQIGANTCVQATQANMPVLTKDARGIIRIEHSRSVGGVNQTAQQLFCTGVSTTKNTLSFAGVWRVQDTQNSAVTLLQLGSSSPLQFGVVSGITTIFGGGDATAGFMSSQDVAVILSSGASRRSFSIDGYPSSGTGNFGATALSGLTLGMSPTGGTASSGGSELTAAVLWTAELNPTDKRAVRVAAQSQFNLVPQARCNVVLQGESILSGFLQDAGQSIAQIMHTMLPNSAKIMNLAGSGQTVAQMVTNYAANTAPAYNATDACNILVVNPGANDIWAAATDVQVEASITSLVAAAKATGWTVFVLTEVCRSGTGGQIAYKDAVNVWLRAGNAVPLSNLIDVAADPNLGSATACVNQIYYRSDATHVNNNAAAAMAAYIAKAVLASPAMKY
jgi:hypothetical protein